MNKKRRERIDNKKKLQEWSKIVKQYDNFKCAVCKKETQLTSHHILPKERWKEYKLNLINGICLCSSCHKYGRFSAHRNGLWFSKWLEKNRLEQYKWVMEVLDGFDNM